MKPFHAFRPQVRRLAKTASWLVAGRLAEMINSVLVAIWVARHLGPAEYGVLSYALTLFALARPLVGFGLSDMVLRDIKLHPDQSDGILGTTVALRAVGTIAAAGIVAVISSFSTIDHPGLPVLCVMLMLAALFAAPRGVEFFFIATGRPQYFVIAMFCNTIIFAVVKIFFIYQNKDVDWFIFTHAAEIVGIGVVSLAAYAVAGHDPRRWVVSSRWFRTYVRRGGVLMFGTFAMIAGAKLAVLFVAELEGAAEAGIYAAASRISELLYNMPVAVAAAVFPLLIELERSNPKRYEETLQLVLDGFAAAALGVALTMTLAADLLISVLLGPAFSASAEILVIHVWICLIVFTRAIVDNWLISRELDALSVRVHIAGVALSIALNLLLIPLYGARGAAYAIVAAYATATFVMLGVSAKGRPILVMVIKAIFTWPVRTPLMAKRLLNRRGE